MGDFKYLDKVLHTDAPDTRYIFTNLIGLPGYQYIHPVKQRCVHRLVGALLDEDKDGMITDIIVFGSTVTLFCDSFSDIDIAILGTFEDYTTKVALYNYGEVDLFAYNKEKFLEMLDGNKFYQEIMGKGVRVYEQLSTSSKG